MRTTTHCLIICAGLACLPTFAQDQLVEDPAHNELRALRAHIVEAISQGDFDATLAHVHTNVVVTWQNNEVCRGHDGLRAFFDRLGRDAFREYKVPPTPDELTILYGDDTGVSFGRVVAAYRILGKELDLESRWTATLVKEDDRWQLAGYHISMNVLDNPILNAATRSLYLVGGVALLLGLIVGVLIGRRRRAPSA
jgi:ketosteroid isomerase-like protein